MATVLSAPLTYEQYLIEDEVKGRYDILDGVRVFMAGANGDINVLREISRSSFAAMSARQRVDWPSLRRSTS